VNVGIYPEDHFALVLWYISVYDVRLLSYVAAQSQFVGVAFCLTEDHCASVAATVNLQNGTDRCRAVVVAAPDCIVLDRRRQKSVNE